MKRKNSTLDKEPRKNLHPFSFEQAFLSLRDYKIIFCISAIIVLCRRVLSIPILAEWKLTMWQEYTVFAVLVFLEVITVGVIAFIPVVLILHIILGHSLKKNIQKLEQAIRQQDKVVSQQDEPYKGL